MLAACCPKCKGKDLEFAPSLRLPGPQATPFNTVNLKFNTVNLNQFLQFSNSKPKSVEVGGTATELTGFHSLSAAKT